MKYNRHSKLIDWHKEQKDLNEKYTGLKRDFLKRGAIFNCVLGENVSSELSGRRPVVIVSNDTGNRFSHDVIVVPLTKSNNKSKTGELKLLPTHYELKRSKYNITFDSVVRAESVKAVNKHRLDSKSIDLVDEGDMKEIEKRLAIALDIS